MRILLIIAGMTALAGIGWTFVNADSSYTHRVQFENGPALNVEIVDTEVERAKGLSGRAGLAEDEGMIFLYETPVRPTFWMKDMRFPIDIIWLADGEVIGIEHDVPADDPPLDLYHAPRSVDAVLEVRAGFAKKNGITNGDRLDIRVDNMGKNR